MSSVDAIPVQLLKDGERAMIICNACRYCEGFCAVFPAMERRLTFLASGSRLPGESLPRLSRVLPLMSAGISILPVPDGTVIHPTAAARTKFWSSHKSSSSRDCHSARADVRPTGAAVFRAFLRHRSTLTPFLRRSSSVSGRPLSSRHWQRPDPPQHVAEQPTGQMPFCQQEPAVPGHASPAGLRFSPAAAGDS